MRKGKGLVPRVGDAQGQTTLRSTRSATDAIDLPVGACAQTTCLGLVILRPETSSLAPPPVGWRFADADGSEPHGEAAKRAGAC
jgi:hypothetical protein